MNSEFIVIQGAVSDKCTNVSIFSGNLCIQKLTKNIQVKKHTGLTVFSLNVVLSLHQQ